MESSTKDTIALHIPESLKSAAFKRAEAQEASINEAKDQDSVALEAVEMTYGPKQAQYGDSIENHDRIAEIANAIAPKNSPNVYHARDIAIVLMALKLSRIQLNPSIRDSYSDLCAYTDILWRIQQRDQATGIEE